jgi:iron complex outermembrane receptor protein
MFTKNALLSTVAVGLVLQTLPSLAAELDEIIVTARKRQESILKVPVVENVITQESLEQHQITDLTDLSAKVPGLSMGDAVLSIGPQISIRGVGTSTLDAGVDQSVSLNIDGLSMTQGLAFQAGLFDLAQVEVLKGPQSLFFGKNSPGGVIALRTADPGDRAEAIARLGYEFEAREQTAELILSSPLTSTFGIRLAGKISDSDGFFYNRAYAAPGTGAMDPEPGRMSATRSEIWRGTAVWKPAEAFDARLKLNFTTDNVDGDAGMGQLTSCPDGKGSIAPGNIPFFNPNDDCKLDRRIYIVHPSPSAFPGVRNGGRPFLDLRQKFGTLDLNYRPGTGITLTSVTGYYNVDVDTMINGTLTGYAAPALIADNLFSRRDFTQEFRADTEFSGPLNFTSGAFFQDGQVFNRVLVQGNTVYQLPAILTTGSQRMDIQSLSFFGQARWKPVTSIEIAGGVRWTREQRGDTAKTRINGVFTRVPVPGISAKNYSPELSLTYTPTDDVTLFGSLKQGYKSGSYTVTTPVTPGSDNSFGDEKVDGGEIGLKSRLLDRALLFNVAGYYYIYKGLQVGTNEPAQNGVPVVRTLNAGKAKIYGVDLDLTYRVPKVEGLTATASVNWNHARFTDLRKVPCWGGQTIAEGCNDVLNATTGRFTAQGDLSGLQLVRAPEWQGNLGVSYGMPIGDALKMDFGVDGQYTSEYPAALMKRADAIQKSYTLLNANVAAGDPDDVWQVAVIANNITDKITTGSCTNLNYANGQILGGQLTGSTARGPAGIDEMTCVARRGRELWVRLTFKTFGPSK